MSFLQPRRSHSRGGLKSPVRWKEKLIQAMLFLSGFLSIFISIAIVYELGKESLRFFTLRQWENTNKPLAADVTPEMTRIPTLPEGSPLKKGMLCRFGLTGKEYFRIKAVEGNTLVVDRGVKSTPRESAPKGNEIYVATKVHLWKFLTGTKW